MFHWVINASISSEKTLVSRSPQLDDDGLFLDSLKSFKVFFFLFYFGRPNEMVVTGPQVQSIGRVFQNHRMEIGDVG